MQRVNCIIRRTLRAIESSCSQKNNATVLSVIKLGMFNLHHSPRGCGMSSFFATSWDFSTRTGLTQKPRYRTHTLSRTCFLKRIAATSLVFSDPIGLTPTHPSSSVPPHFAILPSSRLRPGAEHDSLSEYLICASICGSIPSPVTLSSARTQRRLRGVLNPIGQKQEHVNS